MCHRRSDAFSTLHDLGSRPCCFHAAGLGSNVLRAPNEPPPRKGYRLGEPAPWLSVEIPSPSFVLWQLSAAIHAELLRSQSPNHRSSDLATSPRRITSSGRWLRTRRIATTAARFLKPSALIRTPTPFTLGFLAPGVCIVEREAPSRLSASEQKENEGFESVTH